MDAEVFKNITSLNLENNGIDSSEEAAQDIGALASLPSLEELCLLKNKVRRLESAEKFVSLKRINLSSNQIEDGKIFGDIGRIPNLESVRVNRNPINDIHTYRHLR